MSLRLMNDSQDYTPTARGSRDDTFNSVSGANGDAGSRQYERAT